MKLYCQGETPWFDSACADCPGFLVSGAADTPPSSFVQEPQSAPLDPTSIFFMAAWSKFLDLLPPVPLPSEQKRDAQHKFLQHKRAHTDTVS